MEVLKSLLLIHGQPPSPSALSVANFLVVCQMFCLWTKPEPSLTSATCSRQETTNKSLCASTDFLAQGPQPRLPHSRSLCTQPVWYCDFSTSDSQCRGRSHYPSRKEIFLSLLSAPLPYTRLNRTQFQDMISSSYSTHRSLIGYSGHLQPCLGLEGQGMEGRHTDIP